MEIVLISIVIAVVALLALAWIIAARVGAAAHARRIRRNKLESVASGHREMVAAHEGSVEELAPQAQAHHEAAADHARRADELEQRIERERRQAQFHEERAAETQHEREHV